MFRTGDLEEAWAAVTKAAELGGDVDALKTKISEARTRRAQEHLKLAWKLVKRDRPDQADEEYTKAAALGAEDERLAEAIENTPTARRRRAEEERRERQAELAKQRRALLEEREAKRNAETKARQLFAQRCPLIYENLRTKEMLVAIINKWASQRFGRVMNTAQAHAALQSLGSKSGFIRTCQARAAEATSCGAPKDPKIRKALTGSDGKPPQMWRTWGYSSEVACMEDRPEKILRKVGSQPVGSTPTTRPSG